MPLDVAHPSAPQYPPEGLVPSYAQLRAELASRDRSLRRKVMSLEDATALVNDGDTVGIGGSTMSRTPMGMIWALIRARKSRLSCVRSIVSMSASEIPSFFIAAIAASMPSGCTMLPSLAEVG